MDESRTDLKTFHGEGEEAQRVQQNLLVVKCELGCVRLSSNPPLYVPTVSEYKDQVVNLNTFPQIVSLENVLSPLLHGLGRLPAQYY